MVENFEICIFFVTTTHVECVVKMQLVDSKRK